MYTALVTLSVETYVTIHDQDLVLECISSGQFKDLDPTYLFVGNRPVDRIPSDVKIVICRDYSPNYEHFPNLYDFTGWYVLVKHNLIKAPYVTLIQYDHVVLDPNALDVVESLCNQDPGVIAFVTAWFDPTNWLLQVSNFSQMFQEASLACGVDMHSLVQNKPFSTWPTTQGTAWRTECFEDFIKFVEPSFGILGAEPFGGHAAERLLQVYCLLTHPAQRGDNLFLHQSKDVHGTGAYMRGDIATYQVRNNEFLYQSSNSAP